MKRTFVYPAVVLTAAAACGDPTDAASGSCTALVNVDGAPYGLAMSAGAMLDPAQVGSSPLARVTLNTGCRDILDGSEDPEAFGLEPGQSNSLDAGTPLHAVEGVDPAERMAAELEVGWHPLEPVRLAQDHC